MGKDKQEAEKSDYEKLREAYDPDVRCAECDDPDAMRVEAIEIASAIPLFVTQAQLRRLISIVDEIVYAPCNQPKEGVHWPSGSGCKPKWSRSDAAFLGVQADADAPASGEPTFDDSVFFMEMSARQFMSVPERDRKDEFRKTFDPVETFGQYGVYRTGMHWQVRHVESQDVVGHFDHQHDADLFAEAKFESDDAGRMDKLRDKYEDDPECFPT